ncbi:MAG: glycosyltransferase family 39 protein, partial [Myxococcota bacterium]
MSRARTDVWITAALVALAATLRLRSLTLNSFWMDELFTATVLMRPVARQWQILWSDVHPPVFNLLAWAWSQGIGASEFQLRLLPALLGAAAVGCFFAMFRQRLGRIAAAAAALLAAFLPAHVFHSQDLRSYTLCFLLATLVTWALLEHAARPSTARRWRLGLLCGLLFGTHYVGAFVVAAVLPAMWLLLESGRRERLREGVRVLGTLCVASTPFLPHLLMRRSSMDQYWPDPPSWHAVIELLRYPFRPRYDAPLDDVLALAFLALLGLGLVASLREGGRARRTGLALGVLTGLPPLLIVLASLIQPRVSILIPRLALLFAPPALLLSGLGAARVVRGAATWIPAPLAAGTVLAALPALAFAVLLAGRYYEVPRKQECRGVIRELAALQHEPGVSFLMI